MDGLDGVEFALTIPQAGSGWSVVIEDYGKVAYAYLIREDLIVGDVWLYNRLPAPAIPEWSSKDNMPFLNSAAHTVQEEFAPLASDREVEVRWGRTESKRCTAEIHLRGRFHARLEEGVAPGWCRLALSDGPCAKVLGAAAGPVRSGQ